MIRTGVIGFGVSARFFHLPLLEVSERFEIAAISTSQTDAARSRFPDAVLHLSAEELIGSGAIDLVVITAPNAVHHELAKLALERGLHVVLEKPMVPSAKQAGELASLAAKESKLLSVFHNRRWDGDFRTVKKLIDEGAVGKVRFFGSHFDRFRPEVQERWRETPGPGAGTWWDLGSHLLDQAIDLFGMPGAVTARILKTRDGASVDDYFHVMLHYDDVEVLLHSSSLAAGQNERFKLQGTAGSYLKYGLDPQEGQLRSGLTPQDTEFGCEASEHHGILFGADGQQRVIETLPGCYQHYYRELAAAIEDGAELPVTAEEAVRVIRLLELAEQSQREAVTLEVAPV